jgi:hypothetical protein
MTEHDKKQINDSYSPDTEKKSYTPETGKEQGSYTPTTSQSEKGNPPMPKKK